VTLYWGWHFVLVKAGPEQAATWRRDDPGSFRQGVLSNLVFPADPLLTGLDAVGRRLDRHRRTGRAGGPVPAPPGTAGVSGGPRPGQDPTRPGSWHVADLANGIADSRSGQPGYSWTRQPPTAPASRPVRQLRTDLDGWNLATDQKAGGSSPSERAQAIGPHPRRGGAFLVPAGAMSGAAAADSG